MRSKDSIIELYEWVRQLRKELPLSLVIDNVAARVRRTDTDDRYTLVLELKGLLIEAGRYDEALQVLDEMMERYPDDVLCLIGKATLYLYDLEDPETALVWIDFALRRAHRTGFFRRQALGFKARILLELGRGDALSQVLEEIMSLQIKKGVPDVGRERDFIDRAPPGLISEDVLARYNAFRPKRAGDTDADEPPEWSYPDDGV